MRDSILTILKNNRDSYVSGQTISEGLGVSRSAVWKYINKLKEEGYVIDSLSNNGYKMISAPDLLTMEEIKDYLDTRNIGSQILHFNSIDSTNSKAKELAVAGASHGTVVISEEQTSGRGRFGRQWSSPKHKGIWMSVILRPDIDPVNASNITLLGSAAVFEAMKAMGVSPGIKWPNDIILKGRKLCGILTEMSSELNQINYLIMGIGVNVNTSQGEFPEELKNIATSLKSSEGHDYSRQELTGLILSHFERFYDKFIKENDMKSAIEISRKHSVLLGKEIQIFNKGVPVGAKAIDINDQGLLVIEHPDGKMESIISGEVSMNGLFGYSKMDDAKL